MNQIVLLVIQLNVATVKNKNVLLLASYSIDTVQLLEPILYVLASVNRNFSSGDIA